MNAVWIMLWISSQSIVVNDVQIGVELIDHSSIRATKADAIAWKRELRSHGVGVHFEIYESFKKEDE